MTISTHKPETPLKCPVCDYDMLTGECVRTYDEKLTVCSLGCCMQYNVDNEYEKNSLANSETASETLAAHS